MLTTNWLRMPSGAPNERNRIWPRGTASLLAGALDSAGRASSIWAPARDDESTTSVAIAACAARSGIVAKNSTIPVPSKGVQPLTNPTFQDARARGEMRARFVHPGSWITQPTGKGCVRFSRSQVPWGSRTLYAMNDYCSLCQRIEAGPYCPRHGVVHRPFTVGERYEIDELIGAGSLAFVFGGRDSTLARAVAVKLLRAEVGGEAQQRFLREAGE